MRVWLVDIGNTRVKISVSLDGALSGPVTFPTAGALGGLGRALERIAADAGAAFPFDGGVISSVVPSLTAPVAGALERQTRGHVVLADVDAYMRAGLAADVDAPAEVGQDRLAACLGALGLCAPPVAVVDFGTATTVNFVMPVEGGGAAFVGGAIMPGLTLMGRSLSEGTARLPLVEPRADVRAVSRDTSGNIAAGIVLGAAGAVQRIVAEGGRELGVEFSLVVTGGARHPVFPHLGPRAVEAGDLGLRGLLALYDSNA